MTGAASPALALPRAAALTAELVSGDAPAVPAAALAEARRRLRRDLSASVEAVAGRERLVLDGYRLRMAEAGPAAPADEPFVVSPRACRRAVGLAAVARCVRGRSPAPQWAVAEVLGGGEDEEEPGRPPWWAPWYRSLSDGGKAVVAAEATTWATQLWTALDWASFDHPAVVGGRDDWWDCPDTRRLTLRGRAEVRAWAGGRPVMVTVHGGSPGPRWLPVVGFPALVAGLARGEQALPVRVVGLWPASGQVRILPVDDAVVDVTAGAVVSAVDGWAQRRTLPDTA